MAPTEPAEPSDRAPVMPSSAPQEGKVVIPSGAPKERNARNLAVPLAAALLLSCAVVPGFVFTARPAGAAVGLLLLIAAGPGLGYLILRYACHHLPYRVRLAAATGLGLALLAPAQLLAGLAGTAAVSVLDVAALALGLSGLVLGARDWRTAPPGEGRVAPVTVLVTGAITLAFCLPAAREMTLAPDGSLIVQYLDSPFHAADGVALQHVPARHPLLPSVGLHYHYLFNLIAARVALVTGLGPADALYRVVRPLAILGCLCGFAALPALLIGGSARRPVAWLGPAIACGLPAVQLLRADWGVVAGYLGHGGDLSLAIPVYGWDFGGDMLVSVGGLGLGLLLPLMVILLPDRARSLRPLSGLVLGLVVGATLGFNAPAYALCVAGLAGATLAELLRRRSAVGLAVALVVAVACGLALTGQIVGSGLGAGALGEGEHASLGAVLLGSYHVARTAVKLVQVKAFLAVVAVAVLGRGPRVIFLIGVIAVAVVAMAAGLLGDAGGKYLREGVSLGAACLAVGGAAWLVARGGEARRPVLRGLAWALIGLWLVCGVLATTQFLWRNNGTYRIAPALTTSLRAMGANLPLGAFVAGPEMLVSPEWLADTVVPAHPDQQGPQFVRYVLRYTVVALLGRPAVIGAPDAATYGYAPDPPAAAASAADIARLFSVREPAEALGIARRHGVTHLLLPPGSDLPWGAVPAGPGLRLFEITGSGTMGPRGGG